MFADGVTDDGSSSVPTRTTVNPTRPVVSENKCDPHVGQNRRVTVFPLSAGRLYSAIVPDTLMLSVGKITFTVPLDEIRWQSRHQQMREAMGSASIS
jgi:hypothetical protein